MIEFIVVSACISVGCVVSHDTVEQPVVVALHLLELNNLTLPCCSLLCPLDL